MHSAYTTQLHLKQTKLNPKHKHALQTKLYATQVHHFNSNSTRTRNAYSTENSYELGQLATTESSLNLDKRIGYIQTDQSHYSEERPPKLGAYL